MVTSSPFRSCARLGAIELVNRLVMKALCVESTAFGKEVVPEWHA